MKKFVYQNKYKIIYFLLLLISVSGIFNNLLDITPLKSLKDFNHEFINSNRKSSINTFLLFTGLKTILSILEGSTLGFSFIGSINIQVGDAVEPVLDIVEICWKIILSSTIFLSVIEFILNNIDKLLFFTIPFFFISGLLRTLELKRKFLKNIANTLFLISIYLNIFLIIIIPISIGLYSYMSDHMTNDLKNELLTTIQDFKENIDIKMSYLKDIDYLKERYNSIIGKLSEQSESLIGNMIHLITLYILDIFIFPMIILWGIYYFSKLLINFIIKKYIKI